MESSCSSGRPEPARPRLLGVSLTNRRGHNRSGEFRYIEVEPHALASAALGKSQQAVKHLSSNVIAEQASLGPLIVVLGRSRNLWQLIAPSLAGRPIQSTYIAPLMRFSPNWINLRAQTTQLLFIATSNFENAIDAAFISRADLVEDIGLPTAGACERILTDTVMALAAVFPRLKNIVDDRAFQQAVQQSVGLDARRIRKSVLAACARDKRTALDPGRLTAADILASVEQASRNSCGAPMTVISRRIISTPVRGAAETWTIITNLLAPADSDGKRELARVAGLACS